MSMQKFTNIDLMQLLEDRRENEIISLVKGLDPADIVDLLENIEPEELKIFFSIIDPVIAADILVDMDWSDIDDFIDLIADDKLAVIISNMASDDQADFYSYLDEERQKEILKLLPETDRIALRQLLGYDEESAGGIMTPEFCAIKTNETVQEAIYAIANQEYDDPISMIFAVDQDNRLKGAIHVSELLSKPRNSKILDIIEDIQAVAKTNDDQETVANNFRKYDLFVMPVIDSNGVLVGRVTVDDVMDVIQDEAVEDIAKMAGAPDMEVHEDSPFKVATLRLPWLLITMITGLIISLIIQNMIKLTAVEGVVAYIPVVMAMGGNTGMQASALTVRGIALGEIEFGKLFKISLKEICVGTLMGIVCGGFSAGIIWFKLSYLGGASPISPLKMAFVVAISMCTAMAFAALCGTLLPIILHKLKIDPALASGPFVTTGNDLAASMIYFAMCFFLLKV